MASPGYPPVRGSDSPSAAVGPAWRPGVVIWLLRFRWIRAVGVARGDPARPGPARREPARGELVRHDGIGFFLLGRPIGLMKRRVVRGSARIPRHLTRVPRPGGRARGVGARRAVPRTAATPPERP